MSRLTKPSIPESQYNNKKGVYKSVAIQFNEVCPHTSKQSATCQKQNGRKESGKKNYELGRGEVNW
jgi:hypothetical protein